MVNVTKQYQMRNLVTRIMNVELISYGIQQVINYILVNVIQNSTAVGMLTYGSH